MSQDQRDKIIQALTGAIAGLGRPSAVSALGEGGKVQPDGTYLHFPGNTFLFHLKNSDPVAYSAFEKLIRFIEGHPELAEYFSVLPLDSMHMTVFCGMSGVPLGQDGYSTRVDRNASLDEHTRTFEEALRTEKGPAGFVVSPYSVNVGESLRVLVVSDNDDEHQKLLDMRRLLQDVTGIDRGDLTSYQTHISLAYPKKFIPVEKAPQICDMLLDAFSKYIASLKINLGRVEFCEFEDMRHFKTLGFLGPDGYERAGAVDQLST
jgi:hypothetical protein